jgi:antitoxin MazE
MLTSIQRWGNSLAVRIPKVFAADAKLSEDTLVELALEDGRIVISPARNDWKLEDLVNRITPANRHRAAEWGSSTGKEAW